jgi:glyoxylase-like metal-dependent hydrolase (beta-lactamase superfamily II)
MFTRYFRQSGLRMTMLCIAASMSALSGPFSIEAASAGAPFSKSEQTGFFRTRLGRFEITALYDGAQSVDAVKSLNEPAQDTEVALKRSYLDNPLPTSVNAFLVNTGSKLVLVDVGGGAFFGPALGKLQANLRSAGYEPQQVDDILITHMHRDHIGGLLINGTLAFPNATVHANKREPDYWLSKANLDTAPVELKPRFLGVVASLSPYIQAGRYKSFESNAEVLPDIRSVQSYGHTEGHTMYTIESEGHALWLIGDLIGTAAVQLDNPKVAISFDTDGAAAVASRETMLKTASQHGVMIGAAPAVSRTWTFSGESKRMAMVAAGLFVGHSLS